MLISPARCSAKKNGLLNALIRWQKAYSGLLERTRFPPKFKISGKKFQTGHGYCQKGRKHEKKRKKEKLLAARKIFCAYSNFHYDFKPLLFQMRCQPYQILDHNYLVSSTSKAAWTVAFSS